MGLRDSLRSEADRKMWDHILQEYGTSWKPNGEAEALFNVVQQMFDGNEGQVIIDSGLLHNLAACAVVALKYDSKKQIPFDDGIHDHIINRLFNRLLTTLYEAIRERRTKERGGKTYYGFFHIPDWYVHYIQGIR